MERSWKCPVIRLDPADNIVVARQPIAAGTFIPEEGITVKTDIPIGHKIASRAISCGEPVWKYNTVIGYASRDVDAGTHMHNDTIHFDAVSEEYHFCQDYHPVEVLPPHVDAVVPLITSSGCGLEKSGDPLTYLRRVLGGHVKNPNMAGALVCSLGCETNNIDGFFQEARLTPGPMLGRLVIQEEGGSRKAVARGIAMVEAMLPLAEQCRRQPVSVSHLKIGLECGGSDSFSGSSANPALGRAIDLLIKNGGTAVLTEPTELLGVEGALARRARSPEVAQKLIDVMHWWMDYCKGRDSQINGKVTPGNNAGGITNVLEKALGSAKKGSCYGSQHFPTLKIASNTPLFERQVDDMDLNAGTVIDGNRTLEQMGEEIFEALIAAASGKLTKSELFGMGSDEFIVWWLGTTA